MPAPFVKRLLGPVVLAFALAGCADPPTQPEVRMQVTGLSRALGTMPFDATSFVVRVEVTSSAGADGGGLAATREIYWDHSDPFAFVVQLPAGTYGPVHAELHTLYDCAMPPASDIRDVVLGSGTAVLPLTVTAGSSPVLDAPSIAIAAASSYCQ